MRCATVLAHGNAAGCPAAVTDRGGSNQGSVLFRVRPHATTLERFYQMICTLDNVLLHERTHRAGVSLMQGGQKFWMPFPGGRHLAFDRRVKPVGQLLDDRLQEQSQTMGIGSPVDFPMECASEFGDRVAVPVFDGL